MGRVGSAKRWNERKRNTEGGTELETEEPMLVSDIGRYPSGPEGAQSRRPEFSQLPVDSTQKTALRVRLCTDGSTGHDTIIRTKTHTQTR
jgi:hypothetical protein